MRLTMMMGALQLVAASQMPVVLAGCATSVKVVPEMAAGARSDCKVLGHITYEGKPEYLPTVLVENPASPADAVLRYTHEAGYGLNQAPAEVQIVNPLHLVGLPTGKESVCIVGRLEVMRDGSVVRSFAAVAAMERSNSMFTEGETFTEMRRRGLLLVRDNISEQVCADQPATQAILDAATFVHEPKPATP